MTLTDPWMSGSEIRVMVGIGDYAIGNNPMSTIGLGSCVALVLHDESRASGGMAHIMLPCSQGRTDRPAKFADTAVEMLERELRLPGTRKRSLIAKLVGGACMFKTFNGNLNIGERNIEAVREQVRKRGIRNGGEEVGGSGGRSLTYYPAEGGRVLIRRADGTTSTL
ncbi:MAG: chemotaxis protein CheD [Methanomicrobiales archaeon]|nr:chemotaxis protein CheD [Methanomicrobiales archaeon]